MEKLTPELPVLRLGLLGFNPAQQALFETALAVLRTRLRWCLVPIEEADALCVNGSRTTALPDGSLQIAASGPGTVAIRIDPTDPSRPLAFTLPLELPGVSAASTFDMASPASTRTMLEKFEGWLRPIAIQFCVASRIVQTRLDVSSTVYHVSFDGRLVAIVSRRSGIGVLAIADPARLEGAVWARRPELADEIPGHFVQAGLSQVLWEYAMRTTRDLLPAYFNSGPIYWCRPPQLPQRLFRNSHLMIVRELAHAPISFDALARSTGLPESVLARNLAALRLVGSITHDKKRALRASAQLTTNAARSVEGPLSEPFVVALGPRQTARSPADDKTAPAPLVPQES